MSGTSIRTSQRQQSIAMGFIVRVKTISNRDKPNFSVFEFFAHGGRAMSEGYTLMAVILRNSASQNSTSTKSTYRFLVLHRLYGFDVVLGSLVLDLLYPMSICPKSVRNFEGRYDLLNVPYLF